MALAFSAIRLDRRFSWRSSLYSRFRPRLAFRSEDEGRARGRYSSRGGRANNGKPLATDAEQETGCRVKKAEGFGGDR